MIHSDIDAQSGSEQSNLNTKKPWINPEIRDQSINSSTEGKAGMWPTEASPMTGS